MGQQSSRHSHDARSALNSRRESFDSRDIALFTSRFKDILSDPAYDGGIRADSVVEMVTDMGHVFLGTKHYILAPEPIDGIAPVTHIAFRDDSLMAPESLEIKSRKSANKSVSRRSQLYNESRAAALPVSRKSSIKQPSTRRYDPTTEATMGDIDRAMESANMSDDDDNMIIEDENEMYHEPVQRDPSPEPVREPVMEDQPKRKGGRRVKS